MDTDDERNRRAAERAQVLDMRRKILSSPLARYSGFRLTLRCGSCRETKSIPITDLAERLGRDMLISDVLPRLVCRVCKNPPEAVSCDHHVAHWPLMD